MLIRRHPSGKIHDIVVMEEFRTLNGKQFRFTFRMPGEDFHHSAASIAPYEKGKPKFSRMQGKMRPCDPILRTTTDEEIINNPMIQGLLAQAEEDLMELYNKYFAPKRK